MSSIRRSNNDQQAQQARQAQQAQQTKQAAQTQQTKQTTPAQNTSPRDSFTTKNESKGNILTGRTTTTERSHELNGSKYTSANTQTTGITGKSTTMSKGVERADGSSQSREVKTDYGMLGNKTGVSTTSTKSTSDLTETNKLSTTYARDGKVTSQSASQKLEENYKLDDLKLSTSIESKTSTSEAKNGGIFGENKRTTSSETNTSSIEDKNTAHSTSETTSKEQAFARDGKITMSKDTHTLSETNKKDGKSTTFETSSETTKTQSPRDRELTFQSTTDKSTTEHKNGWKTESSTTKESGQKFTTTAQNGESNTKFEDGKLTTKGGFEYKNTHSSTKTTVSAERELYKGNEDLHKQRQATNKNISNAQSIAKEVFGSKELSPKIDTDTHKRSETISAAGYERTETHSANASVWENQKDWVKSGDLAKDGYEAKLSTDVKVLNASGSATTNVKLGGLNNEVSGKLSGQLAVLDANVSGNYTKSLAKIGDAEITAGVEGKGRAFVGADGSLEGKVTASIYPPEAAVTLKGEAFAGAKLEGEVKGHAGPFSVTASGSLNAGAGVEGGLDVGLSDGKLRFQANLGATLGIGASGNVAVEVDVAQIAKIGVEGAKVVGKEIHKAAVNTFDATGDGKLGLDDARAIGSAAVNTVGQGLSDARDAIGSGLSSMGNSISNAFSGW